MHKHLLFTVTLLAAAMSASFANAAVMAKADYSAAKTRIGADYKADQKLCADLKANAKDICSVEAKGKEKIARAELEFAYTGKAADGTKARVATAEAAYAVAKEKCDDLKGNDKDVCVKQAKADEVKALAAAKLTKQVAAARKDAAEDVRDANYKLAAEKCDALSGDAKTNCVAAAKATRTTQAAQAASAVATMAPATVPAMPVAKKEKKGGC
jgi:hypothetical protein